MSEDMTIESYLAAGGVLTSPGNAPPRYRAELMRLMATFVDSELAGAAGFANIINDGPGVQERIAAARIVSEKNYHGALVLRIMGEFGADTTRYANHHPWAERVSRSDNIGAKRSSSDMRLAVFNYPLEGWPDAVVMNQLMGCAVVVQLADFATLSYQPLAEVFRQISPVEARHAELAEEGLAKLCQHVDNATLQASVDYWWPRVAASFGSGNSKRDKTLRAFGLRHRSNSELKAQWESNAAAALRRNKLMAPAK